MINKFLTKFNTEAEYNEFLNSNLCPYINVSYIQATDENKYYKEEDALMMQPFTLHIDRLSNGNSVPLCFIVQQDPTNSGVQSYCRYKINNNNWETFTFTFNNDNWKGDDNRQLYEGDTVQIICKTNSFVAITASREKYDLQCSISGNIMSLFWGDDYIYAPANKLPFPLIPYNASGTKIDYIHIDNLIEGTQYLIDASDLWLPTKNLPEGIFREMFKDYTDLTAGPDIKAKYLPKNACNSMFAGCASLTDMPNILAETTEANSLDSMFSGCTSLVNTTQLHIKDIIGAPSMNFMFTYCTSLVTAPIWDEDVIFNYNIDDYYWDNMVYIFDNCSSLVDASPFYIRANDIHIFEQGFSGVVRACSSLQYTIRFGTSSNPAPDRDFTLTTYFPDTSLVSNAKLYLLMTTGAITVSDADPSLWANGGTVYVLPGSRYLPGGDLYGQLPTNLPSNWTVAEYVEPNTSNQ